MTIDDFNFAADSRNQPGKRVTIEIEQDDGSFAEIELPTKWEVCSVCDGNGKHVNPSIDAGGLTHDDFADDPDFAAEYFGGTYDVTCQRCGGRTTERVVDWDALTPEQRDAYDEQQRADAAYEAERLAEIRMGA